MKEKGMSFIHSPDAAHLLMSEICRSESFLGLEYETDQLAAMQQDCVDYLLPFTDQMVQANDLVTVVTSEPGAVHLPNVTRDDRCNGCGKSDLHCRCGGPRSWWGDSDNGADY